MAVAKKTEPDDAVAAGSGGQVAGKVVAGLDPAQPGQSDGEGQTAHHRLPVGAGVDAARVGLADREARQDDIQGHEGDHQGPQDLDDGGVAEEGYDGLDGGGGQDEHHLEWRPGVITGLGGQGDAAEHDEDQTLGFEADLGRPVEQRDQAATRWGRKRPG